MCSKKLQMYHHASNNSCAEFSLKMHQKRLATALPDPLTGFNGRGREKEREREKTGKEGIAEGGYRRSSGGTI